MFRHCERKIKISRNTCPLIIGLWPRLGLKGINTCIKARGISWSVPYLAGVFALVLQIKPELKQAEISRIIVQTATINKQGLRIINPRGVIDEVKRLS